MDVPYDTMMGFTCEEAGEGVAVYTAKVDARHHNPTGRLHGGVLAGLADAAMGAAYLSMSGSGTNTDLSVRFLRPVEEGFLRARAHVVRQGRRTSLLACDVTDAEGRLVAVAQSQFMALTP